MQLQLQLPVVSAEPDAEITPVELLYAIPVPADKSPLALASNPDIAEDVIFEPLICISVHLQGLSHHL